jgi:hypothetical protein
MHQDQEIPSFLGDLVGNDGHGGDDAQRRALDEGGGNEHAVDKVVKGVADEDQQAAAPMIVLLGRSLPVPVVIMPVPVTAFVVAVTP